MPTLVATSTKPSKPIDVFIMKRPVEVKARSMLPCSSEFSSVTGKARLRKKFRTPRWGASGMMVS